MAGGHTLRDLLHEATHRVPGVPAHRDHPHHGRPAGRQGKAAQRRATSPQAARERSRHRSGNHSSERPPRVLVAWQRQIARLFGQQV